MQSTWTLDQLRTFAEVVNTGSFTRAADALALSQPAVSMQIRNLEQALRTTLLERRPRRLVLTDAGRIVHGYALRVVRMEAELAAEIADLASLEGGLLRVGAGATPSIFTLAGMFAEYYRRWPGVELQVRIGRTAELVKSVTEDALDLAIIASDTGQEGLTRIPVYTEKCVAVAGSGHPLARVDRVDVSELPGHTFVLLPPDSGFRRFLESALRVKDIRLTAAMELSSLEAIKEVVRAGALVSIVPETAAAGESLQSGLHVIELTGAELTRHTVAVHRSDKYISEAMSAFFSLLRERWPPLDEPRESRQQGFGASPVMG